MEQMHSIFGLVFSVFALESIKMTAPQITLEVVQNLDISAPLVNIA
jgi:hypothetical protein